MTSIKQLVDQSYRLINPSNPTVPLHGNDFSFALNLLNDLMASYADDGLMMTISTVLTTNIAINQQTVTVGPSTYVPTPNITVGRMANWESAWIQLQGVDYPLIFQTRDKWDSSFKYEPLSGLPRFIIPFPEVQIVTFRLYPSPSQQYTFNIRGKYQLPAYASTDTLDATLPSYYTRYLKFALAKDIALFKGRAAAWTDLLERTYLKAEKDMQANSEVNLEIGGDEESLLNGSWRVLSGV